MSLALASIEPVEDMPHIGLLNPWSLVGNAKPDETIFFLGANCDWFLGSRVQVSILNNVGKDFPCPFQICGHPAVRVLHVSLYRPSALEISVILQRRGDQFTYRMRGELECDITSLQASHFISFSN